MSTQKLEVETSGNIKLDVDKIRELGSGFGDMSDNEVLESLAESIEEDIEKMLLKEMDFLRKRYDASIEVNAEVDSDK